MALPAQFHRVGGDDGNAPHSLISISHLMAAQTWLGNRIQTARHSAKPEMPLGDQCELRDEATMVVPRREDPAA